MRHAYYILRPPKKDGRQVKHFHWKHRGTAAGKDCTPLTSSPSNTHTHTRTRGLYVCVCVTNHAMTEATVSLPRTMFAFHGAQGVDTEVDFFIHKNAFLSLSLHLRLARSSSAGAAEACHTAANLWLTGFAFWERCGVTGALKCYSAFVKNSNSINSALERMSQETLLTSTLELVLTAIWSHHMQFGSASCQFACYLRSIT